MTRVGRKVSNNAAIRKLTNNYAAYCRCDSKLSAPLMCLMTYVATETALDSSDWEQGRGVMLCPVPREVGDVAKRFSLPNVYLAASSEGCGCGFLTRWKEKQELEQAVNERRELGSLLREEVCRSKKCELLICYAGYETKAITQKLKTSVEDLASVDFDRGWDYEVLLVEINPHDAV